MMRLLRGVMLIVAIMGSAAAVAAPVMPLKETPSLAADVGRKALPAIGERLPSESGL